MTPSSVLRRAALFSLAGWCCAAASLQAHHSFAMFDETQCHEITGTVRALEWHFPHVWLWVTVPAGQKNAGTWGFEAGSPAMLMRDGWKRSSLKPGDQATVTYMPVRGGKQAGAFAGVTLADGRYLHGTENATGCKTLVAAKRKAALAAAGK